MVAIEESKTLEVSWMLFFCFEVESYLTPKCVSLCRMSALINRSFKVTSWSRHWRNAHVLGCHDNNACCQKKGKILISFRQLPCILVRFNGCKGEAVRISLEACRGAVATMLVISLKCVSLKNWVTIHKLFLYK